MVTIKGKPYKADNPIKLFDTDNLPPQLSVYIETFHLANIYRAGWLEPERDIPIELGESDAEHIMGMRYAMHMIRFGDQSLIAEDIKKITGNRRIMNWLTVSDLIDMHELPEIRSGDITPSDGLSKKEKHEIEEKALLLYLPVGDVTELFQVVELWDQFEENTLAEVIFAHDLDYFQMIVRARLYELQTGKDLSSFYEKREEKLRFSIFKQLFQKLL